MGYDILIIKSKSFALRTVKLYKYLTVTKKEYLMANQLFRSGTSIGANIRESKRAQSDADFYTKLTISLKEAEETAYWLELLYESGYISDRQFESIYYDCNELISLLVSATKKQKQKLNKNNKKN